MFILIGWLHLKFVGLGADEWSGVLFSVVRKKSANCFFIYKLQFLKTDGINKVDDVIIAL